MYIIRQLRQIVIPKHFHQQQMICRAKSQISVGKQSKILQRLIQGKSSKKKWHENVNSQMLPSATSLSNNQGESKHISRRKTVLNKLFIQHISDMLSNSDCSQKISGYGLEISHVKMTSDFHLINVYWTAKNVGNDDANLESTLQSIAIQIRHELSQLRLMGEVPRICFVKDRALSKLAEVDNLLAMADFGDDYVPTTLSSFRAEIIRKDFTTEKENDQCHLENDDFQLPTMRYDVLGLDQMKIMNKIKQKMTKNRQAWEKYELQQSGLNRKPTFVSDQKNDIDSKEILSKFLMTKQYHRGGNLKRNQKYFEAPEHNQQSEHGDLTHDEDYDYIDDEIDDLKH